MSMMSGNQYAEYLEKVSGQNATGFEADAIMALAFEQRTANLINLMRLQSDYVQAGMGMTSEAAEAIEQRLGLSDKDD